MPNYWILKTEPTSYSYDQLAKDKSTVWDGVKNPVALKNIRSMKRGDQAFIYHTGNEKSIVGMARITSGPYPDPEQNDEKLVVVDLRAAGRVPTPVPLADIKAQKAFADLALVRQGRLSVVPVKETLWRKLMKMAGK